MRQTLPLLLCAAILGGCSSTPSDPSGIWINQAAINAAAKEGKLRESLLAYGPNLEWQIDQKTGEAHYSNGFELGEGRLAAQEDGNWRVNFYGDYQEVLEVDGDELVQQASEIPWDDFEGIRTLGVTAGASAPESLVVGIVDAFRTRFDVTVESVVTKEERIGFNVPRELREAAAP